jgi:hypothetical protein
LWSVVVLGLAGGGCGTFDPELYRLSFSRLQDSASRYQAAHQYPEAIYLSRALLDAEPANQDVLNLLAESLAAAPECGFMVRKRLLGVNLSDRSRNPKMPVAGAIVLYPLNRALDIIDLVTVEAGVCLGVGAKAAVTDALGAGAQVSAGEVLIGLNRRHLSSRATVDEFLEILPVETRAFLEARAYTGGAYAFTYGNAGVKKPSNAIYQRARDYWSVGARAEAAIAAVNAEVHPLELWDFVGGIFFLDPLKDDVGVTRGIALAPLDKAMLEGLAKQVRLRR